MRMDDLPPQYDSGSSQETSSHLNLMPLEHEASFQVGKIGVEHAFLRGEAQIKGTERLARKVELLFIGTEWYKRGGDCITLIDIRMLLWTHPGAKPPPVLPFEIPLPRDLPQCIHLIDSSLEYALTLIVSYTDGSSSIYRVPVHIDRASSQGMRLWTTTSEAAVAAARNPPSKDCSERERVEASPSLYPVDDGSDLVELVDFAPLTAAQAMTLEDPLQVTATLPSGVFTKNDPIPVVVRIQIPSLELVSTYGERLRTVSVELVRDIRTGCESRNDVEVLSRTITRTGKLARFSATRPIVMRLILHPHLSMCESITQSTAFHRISFRIQVRIGLISLATAARHDALLSKPILIVPDPIRYDGYDVDTFEAGVESNDQIEDFPDVQNVSALLDWPPDEKAEMCDPSQRENTTQSKGVDDPIVLYDDIVKDVSSLAMSNGDAHSSETHDSAEERQLELPQEHDIDRIPTYWESESSCARAATSDIDAQRGSSPCPRSRATSPVHLANEEFDGYDEEFVVPATSTSRSPPPLIDDDVSPPPPGPSFILGLVQDEGRTAGQEIGRTAHGRREFSETELIRLAAQSDAVRDANYARDACLPRSSAHVTPLSTPPNLASVTAGSPHLPDRPHVDGHLQPIYIDVSSQAQGQGQAHTQTHTQMQMHNQVQGTSQNQTQPQLLSSTPLVASSSHTSDLTVGSIHLATSDQTATVADPPPYFPDADRQSDLSMHSNLCTIEPPPYH